MNKLFCDIDSTINNHWERIRRFTSNGSFDKLKAFSREEIMKDDVLPHSIDSLNKLSSKYEIHFLTARPFKDAYNITKDWLDAKGFKYKSIIVVDRSIDKLKYVTEPGCVFIDDLSRKHEIYPPYTILYWDVIAELNRHNVNYEIFKNNWLEITKKYINKQTKLHTPMVHLIMAEFGEDRTNKGGATFNSHRLNPTYDTFKRWFPDCKVTLYTDHPNISIPKGNIELKVVDPIFKGQHRYGNRCNDYYKVFGLLESDCDVAIALDSDMAVVSPEVKSLIDITKKFGSCVPQNPRMQVRFDGIKGADADYNIEEDGSRGNGMANNMSPICLHTKSERGKKLMRHYLKQMETHPVRGPLAMWRASWKSGINPYLLPLQWCVCPPHKGPANSLLNDTGNEIMIHVGHDNVKKFYFKD